MSDTDDTLGHVTGQYHIWIPQNKNKHYTKQKLMCQSFGKYHKNVHFKTHQQLISFTYLKSSNKCY